MKIVILTTGFPRWPGDLFGFFIAELAEALAEAGDTVTVVAPAHRDAPAREARDGVGVRRVRYAWPAGLQKLAYGGGVVPNLRDDPFLAALLPGFLAALAWQGSAEAIGADLFHGQWIVSGLLGRLTGWLHGRPVVVTLRGSDLAILRGLPDWLARRLLAGFDAVTCVSDEIRQAVLDYGLEADRVFLTPNGVNTELFSPRDKIESRRELGLGPDEPLMVWAGRLAPEKGLTDLIEALPSVLQTHSSARLVLIGDGPERDALDRLAGERGVREALDLRPAVERSRLAVWYGAADLVCLPSLREGRPNTVLEAMACGRPVLATAVGGVPELIENERGGRLVEPRNPAAFARAASEMLADPGRLAAMGAAGPKRLAELGLTWARSAERVREIYRTVMEARRRSAEPRLIGRPWTPALLLGWAALAGGVFLYRYWDQLNFTYGITAKLKAEGLAGLVSRWLGL